MEEQAAAALVSECVVGFQLTPLPPDVDQGEFAHSVLVVTTLMGETVVIPRSVRAARASALKWRRTMETLNALQCCRGFGLSENPRFWREQLAKISDDDREFTKSCLYALHHGLLSRFRLRVSLEECTERVASVIAVAFSMDPAAPANRVRQEVHTKLQAFLTRSPPPLQLELDLYDCFRGKLCNKSWHLAKRTLWDLNRMWRLENASAFPEKVAMVFGTGSSLGYVEVDASSLSVLSEMQSLACVELREIKLFVVSDAAPSAEICVLMRDLIRVGTLQKFSWLFSGRDARSIAAICSALPAMPSLQSLSLRFRDQCYQLANTSNERGMVYVWLAFALLHRKFRGLRLSLDVQVCDGARVCIERALSCPNCLALLLPAVIADPVLAIHGASALLCTKAIVTTKPHLQTPTEKEPTSFIVFQQTRVTVIAQSGSEAIVVWPGIGLVWSRTRDLSEWRTVVPPALRNAPAVEVPLVVALHTVASHATGVVDLLELIGEHLSTLTLSLYMDIDYEIMSKLLACCPRLETLSVVDAELDIVMPPLLKGYSDGACTISTLALNKIATQTWIQPTISALFDCLGDPNHPASKLLKHLSLDSLTVSEDDLRIIAGAVRCNRTLQFLRVEFEEEELEEDHWEQDDDEAVGEADVGDIGEAAFGDLVDVPVVQTEESKRGMYTFMLVAPARSQCHASPLHDADRALRGDTGSSLRFMATRGMIRIQPTSKGGKRSQQQSRRCAIQQRFSVPTIESDAIDVVRHSARLIPSQQFCRPSI